MTHFSLIPASGWWSMPMKYSYKCCMCITYHDSLLHRSCDWYCFPLFLRPSVSFGAINAIVTSWFLLRYAQGYRSTKPFQKYICQFFNESVFYGVFGVDLRFVPLLLDAEFKYNNIFSIWVKSTVLNWNKKNSSRNKHDKYERKILFYRLPLNKRPFRPRGIKIM